MIVTLSLNPSIDRTVSVAKFTYGGMNRVVESRDDASGKSVNVALVAAALSADVKCVGLLPKEGGQKVCERLEGGGVPVQFIEVPGRLRVNIKLLDESKGIVTEINDRGAPTPEGTALALTELVLDTVQPGDWLALNGSIPQGFSQSFYGELIHRLRGRCRCALDAEGEPLRAGIAAKPALIKPNKAELEMLINRKLETTDEVARAATDIQHSGVETVVVSLGEGGALLADAKGVLFAPALKVPVRSTVGAGDSMIAGLLTGFSRGCAREEAFRMGVAAASASVVSEGTRLVDAGVYNDMLTKTIVQRL